MEEVILNCAKMLDKTKAHKYIQEKLDFPEYYGMNLDALYDILTEPAPRSICLMHPSLLEDGDGYARALLQVFTDAADKNDALKLRLYERDDYFEE